MRLLPTFLFWLRATFLFPVHREGYIFIAFFSAFTLIFIFLNWTFLSFIGLLLTIWCIGFFRDPKRVITEGDNLVLSPADGIVNTISEEIPPTELGFDDSSMLRISIFMNIFDVHVNRAPTNGRITKIDYKPGKFFNASLDKASVHNERQSYVLETPKGQKIIFIQIAGFLARRIVKFVEEGQEIYTGERFGMIRFGSCVQVYLPKNAQPSVQVGQTCVAGETILATLVD